MTALEDRIGSDGEVELTGIAAVEPTSAAGDAIPGFALRALRTIRPQPGFQVLTCGLFIREKLKQFESANSGPAHTKDILVGSMSEAYTTTHCSSAGSESQKSSSVSRPFKSTAQQSIPHWIDGLELKYKAPKPPVAAAYDLDANKPCRKIESRFSEGVEW